MALRAGAQTGAEKKTEIEPVKFEHLHGTRAAQYLARKGSVVMLPRTGCLGCPSGMGVSTGFRVLSTGFRV